MKSRVLIVSSNSSARRSLQKFFCEEGISVQNIKARAKISDAMEDLKAGNISLIISDYMVAGRSGIELFEEVQRINPYLKDSLFVLMSRESCKAEIAQAAEEEVDAFVLMPFTAGSIRRTLFETIEKKINPSKYMKLIEEGKKILLEEKNPQKALNYFQLALSENSKPSLACFYYAQVKKLMNEEVEAMNKLIEGLNYNQIHYRCLVGLYEMYLGMGKEEDAYDIVKKVANLFPANPNRLAEVIRLAVVTQNYNDVHDYFNIFTEMEERNDLIIKHICSGLAVCGKHHLINNRVDRALESFRKLITAEKSPKFVKIIMEFLIDFNQAKYTEEFRKKMEINEKSSDYQLADFLGSAYGANAGRLAQAGMALYHQRIYHSHTYIEVMLKCFEELDKPNTFHEFLELGKKLYPNKFKDREYSPGRMLSEAI